MQANWPSSRRGGHPAALRQVPRHHGRERRHLVGWLTLIPQSHSAHVGERHTSVHPVPGRGMTDRGDFCGRLCQSGRNDTKPDTSRLTWPCQHTSGTTTAGAMWSASATKYCSLMAPRLEQSSTALRHARPSSTPWRSSPSSWRRSPSPNACQRHGWRSL